MAKRTYTKEFKVEAVRQVVEGGKSVASVARDLGISANLLHRWQRALEEEAAEKAFPGKGRVSAEGEELRRLRRELADALEENSFLKKAAAYFAKDRGRGTK